MASLNIQILLWILLDYRMSLWCNPLYWTISLLFMNTFSKFREEICVESMWSLIFRKSCVFWGWSLLPHTHHDIQLIVWLIHDAKLLLGVSNLFGSSGPIKKAQYICELNIEKTEEQLDVPGCWAPVYPICWFERK